MNTFLVKVEEFAGEYSEPKIIDEFVVSGCLRTAI